MNNQIIYPFINNYLSKYKSRELGFTLIELLVVVIILGLLMAVSLPNTIRQVGKARETEAKNGLGVLGRAQQSYHLENRTFTNNFDQLGIGSSLPEQYFSYPSADVATASIVKQRAVSKSPDFSRVRDYASGVYFEAGSFQFNLCQSEKIGSVVEAPTVFTDNCTNNGVKLEN